jgi:nucleoside-diphosphate-sugar epimerase
VETNITGTLNMLEAARRHGVDRLVVTSTSEVYGTALHVPIDEAHPLQAQSPYSASKIGAEKLAESYWRSFEMPVTVVRPFNTFGPRQSARAVIPTILMQLLNGRDEIRLGDPHTTRDFNYVADTVEGLMRIALSPAAAGDVINIGTGRDISIGDVAERAQQVTGQPARIVSDPERIRPAASEVRRLCAANDKLRALTGWVPPVRIEEGLRQTAAWLKKRAKTYDPDRYYI